MATLKQRAATQISRAVANGQLARPARCPVCRAAAKLCGVPRDLARPVETVEWACHRCLRAARAGIDLDAQRLAVMPEAATPALPRCTGHTARGRCRFRGRYRRGASAVCASHLVIADPIGPGGGQRARRGADRRRSGAVKPR